MRCIKKSLLLTQATHRRTTHYTPSSSGYNNYSTESNQPKRQKNNLKSERMDSQVITKPAHAEETTVSNLTAEYRRLTHLFFNNNYLPIQEVDWIHFFSHLSLYLFFLAASTSRIIKEVTGEFDESQNSTPREVVQLRSFYQDSHEKKVVARANEKSVEHNSL